MSEPPARVTAEGVEAEPRKVGHRTLDLILAGSAILMSMISLIVAVKHGAIMQDLVSANSWPLLQASHGNFDPEKGAHSIYVEVENAGVGPAIVRDFQVSYKGRAYEDVHRLLRDCCGLQTGQKISTVTSAISSTVVTAGEKRKLFSLDRDPASLPVWDKLNKERYQLSFQACYCSALGECWQSDLRSIDPKPVPSCSPSNRNEQGWTGR